MGVVDTLLYGFFLSHIPITLLFDLQVLFPDCYPQQLRDVVSLYADGLKDPYLTAKAPTPLFLKSFIWCELLFQLPIFVLVVYSYHARANWIRLPGIAYGAHVTTTVIPILADLMLTDFSDTHGPETLQERLTLVGIYFPYLLFPLVYCVKLCLGEPFPAKAKAS